jgi:UDP-N-acetylmuramyl pentapeptide synthase
VVPGWLRAGDLVLLKGSRGMRLEKVANAIGEFRGGGSGVTLKSA